MANVFICHRKADVILAERLSQEIKSAGHEIWLDDWKIDLGDSIDGSGSNPLIRCFLNIDRFQNNNG